MELFSEKVVISPGAIFHNRKQISWKVFTLLYYFIEYLIVTDLIFIVGQVAWEVL